MTHVPSGPEIYGWAKDLFPICRSLTGNGVRETLTYIGNLLPGLERFEVPTGTQAFDWTVPNEWNIRDAWIENEAGYRIVDFANSNLHVVGYSQPIDRWMSLEELDTHLHSTPELPDAIPYVTSYYAQRWGFCLPHRQREQLKPGRYRAVIDATHAPGHMSCAELVLPGREDREILLSTYVCHPSMANNEVSGPVVTTALAQWLMSLSDRRYTYRIFFGPETLGAIWYLSQNLNHLKAHVDAGFVVTNVGDERNYSLLSSRHGETLADRAAQIALRDHAPSHDVLSYVMRASDERQYCAPGIDLPVVSMMRSRHGNFPEYHTSLDDLSAISPRGLEDSFTALRTTIELLEENAKYENQTLCEPMLSRHGLYRSLGTKQADESARNLLNFLSYADGQNDLIDICAITGMSVADAIEAKQALSGVGLIQQNSGHQTKLRTVA